MARRICWVAEGDRVPYREAWALQKSLVARRVANPSLPDVLLLLEHPPVYTLGTGSSEAFVRFDPDAAGVELHRTERGGEVTYHCPGQLVGYPILDLHGYRQDLHWYLRHLETTLIEVLARYDLCGERLPGLTGVWIDGRKVAAIGIKVRRWVTMHGFALNVCPDLSGFERIVPCGIVGRPVGSLAQFRSGLNVARVRTDLREAFAARFAVELAAVPLAELARD